MSWPVISDHSLGTAHGAFIMYNFLKSSQMSKLLYNGKPCVIVKNTNSVWKGLLVPLSNIG
jgi:hypothetical protein